MSEELRSGPVPPYGVPIRDAIARGDLREMRVLSDSVKPALAELEAAIQRLEAGGGHGGARVPYGPPIHDAIARGDLNEMRALYQSVQPAFEALEAAIQRLETHGGAREPYGPAIRDAMARGELYEMKATAEATRQALYKIAYAPVTAENETHVRAALADLEAAIRKLEGQGD